MLLDAILRDASREVRESGGGQLTLAAAYEGLLASKQREDSLKRSTVSDYDCMAERVFRELGAESPVSDIAAATVIELFDDLRAERVIGAARAEHAQAAGKDIRQISTTALHAWLPGTRLVEVATKQEAIRIAEERGWTWKHRRRGVYRVTPVGAQRPRRIRRGEAAGLRGQGWDVEVVERKHRVLRKPASTQTHRKYRDFLNAIFDWAIAQGAMDDNQVKGVGRKSRRGENSRILRRSDFYDRSELDRLLEAEPGDFERAFWLCGFHAGLRLTGEALGLLWGAVDFDAQVLRPYGNWVRNGYEDTTKTGLVEPVPTTPELQELLASLKDRVWAVADDDFVFTRDQLTALPADERALREAFRTAAKSAGLKAIPMYNSRHNFGTALAREGVDVRTIQTLMRHKRLSTTEIYMAYSPRPDLHRTLVRALSRK